MGASGNARVARALRSHWRRWTAYVETFARGPRRRRRVHARDYEACQHQLLAASQAVAGNGDLLGATLAELARPWVSVRAFDLAEQEVLEDLVARCRAIDRRLGIYRLPPMAWRWIVGLVLAALVLILSLIFGQELADAAQFAYNYALYWAAMLRLAIQDTGPAERIIAGAVAVVLLGAWLLSRITRS